MAYRLSAEKKDPAPLQDDAPSHARLRPAQAHRILRQWLEGLPDRVFLSNADVALLSRRLATHRYAAGETILMEGAHGECLGLVTQGQVAGYSSLSGRSSPTVYLLPGSVFGEAMLTAGQPSNSTFRAVTDAQVRFLRRSDYLAVLGQRQSRFANWVNRWLRRLAASILVLVTLGTSLAVPSIRRASVLLPYSAGLWLGHYGHADLSATALALTVRLAPDRAMPHLSLGNLYLRQGRLDQAEVELQQALALLPEMAEVYNSIGLLYAARGDQATAVESFRLSLAIEPGRAAVERNLALSLQQLGQRDESLRHYAMARSLDEPSPVPLINEAIARYQAGDLAAARSAALQALRLDDTSAPAYTLLGAADLALQDPQAAAFALKRAIRRDPAYIPAHFYLGLAAKALDQPELAIAAFERVQALDPAPLARREARLHLEELYAHGQVDAERRQPASAKERR